MSPIAIILLKTISPDNDKDHRAGKGDHWVQIHTQVRLRVHRIVIPRISSGYCLDYFGYTLNQLPNVLFRRITIFRVVT